MTIRTGTMRSGKLNRRIVIQQMGANANGTRGWQDLFSNVWAECLTLTASEAVHQLGPMNVQATQLNIRYRPGIKAQMRVILRGRVLEIVSVINEQENDTELQLMCREPPPGT